MNRKIVCVVGTRPEAIKMAPVIRELRARGFEAPILVTAQHRHLLDQMLQVFGLEPAWDLDIMRPDQGLGEVTGRLVPRLEHLFREAHADAVLAQGDTATVFCAALAAFYAGIPFGHVEAGLRSGDLAAPFPEEAMRRLTAVVTRWHFAPTAQARTALLAEGHPEAAIYVTGNTVIDALLETAGREPLPWPAAVPPLNPAERLVLVTLHRRENFGAPLDRALAAIATFADQHPSARIVFPVHPNPHVRTTVQERLGGRASVNLIEPLDYPELVALLTRCCMVWTDSGGLQEEGPALGKPVLVFRDVTERPEAVEAGGVRLVGTDPDLFLSEAARLWDDPQAYASMAVPRFPYGDGHAARRIVHHLSESLPLKD